MSDHTEEEQEEYPLVYNMWIENLTINCKTVIMQTGEPNDPPPPVPINGDGS